MSKIGLGSGVDLLKRMQPGEDLEYAWLTFDHVKRVKKWTIMGYYVYDPAYCRIMTIVIPNMQSQDVAAQLVMWKNLNNVVRCHGVENSKFKGFIVDRAQAKWNAIPIVYESGDILVPIPNKEQTCVFYLVQSLEKHSKIDI